MDDSMLYVALLSGLSLLTLYDEVVLHNNARHSQGTPTCMLHMQYMA